MKQIPRGLRCDHIAAERLFNGGFLDRIKGREGAYFKCTDVDPDMKSRLIRTILSDAVVVETKHTRERMPRSGRGLMNLHLSGQMEKVTTYELDFYWEKQKPAEKIAPPEEDAILPNRESLDDADNGGSHQKI